MSGVLSLSGTNDTFDLAAASTGTTGAEIFLGGSVLAAARINASAGVGQPILGLHVLVENWTSQSLTLTLSVSAGVLAYGTVTPAATLVLTAASPVALNNLLSELVYTAGLSTDSDTLVASGNTGLLAGLRGSAAIEIEPGGTVAGFASGPTAEQTAIFTGSVAGFGLVTQAAAPGAVSISGVVDFADLLVAGGIGGTALSIDAGGSAVFEPGSVVRLAANAVIGDASGAGTLGISTNDFTIGTALQNANLLVGGNAAAAGSVVEVTGGLTVIGAVVLGQAASLLEVSGKLTAASTTIGAAGTLIGTGAARLDFGSLVDSGSLLLENTASASARELLLSGRLALQGGTTLGGLSSAVIGAGGALLVGPDAAFSASGLDVLGGNVLAEGTLQVAGNLLADAEITLAGGVLQAAAATFAGGAVLSGFGEQAVTGAGAKIVLAGEILAEGGVLTLDGNVTMRESGSIVIAGSAALELMQGASGGAISFAGAKAILTVDDLAAESSAVRGMLAGDVIDLVGISPSLVSDAGGVITARSSGGNVLGSFALQTASGQPAVTVVSDDQGGALITLGGEMACFARGTRLLTPNGYVPVEAFKPGDPIITRLGIRRAVRWIGRRNVELGLKSRRDMRPVVLLPSAMGPGLPSRAVRLSPSHAVFVDGVLVPVMHLVNGATILRERKSGQVSYFHIELDRHDVLMAEGLPVESYIDTGNRGEFQHELGVRGKAGRPCAPLVTGGPKLARIRRQLHETTLRAGFSLRHAPALQGIVGGEVLQPELRLRGAIRTARFHLPKNADALWLRARSAAPAETDPESNDRRELAICLRQPRADKQLLRLGQGWHAKAPGDAGTWMSGSGEILLLRPAMELTLNLAAVVQSWQQPAQVDFAGAGD